MADIEKDFCESYFKLLKKRVVELEKKLNANVIFFEGELNHISAISLHKIIRKLKKDKILKKVEQLMEPKKDKI